MSDPPPAWSFTQLAMVTGDGQRWVGAGSAIRGETLTATVARLYSEATSGELGTAYEVLAHEPSDVDIYGLSDALTVTLLISRARPGTAAGLPIIWRGTALGRFVFRAFPLLPS